MIFIDLTDPANPLKREEVRRKTVKTMAPYGVNIKEGGKFFYLFAFRLQCHVRLF